MRSLSAFVLLWTWSSSECLLDMAWNTCRSSTFVYDPCGACSSSIHPCVVNYVGLRLSARLRLSASTRARVIVGISARDRLRVRVMLRV